MADRKRILLTVFAALALVSCGKETDTDKIGDAQYCLDKLDSPTKEQANACIAMVDGMDSTGAQNIRCSGAFIREGIVSGDRLIAAFRAIDGGAGGSGMQEMMGLLSFTSEGAIAADFANTGTAFQACLASGAKGATLLSSFSYFTMSLMNFFNAKNACTVAPKTEDGYTFYDFQGCVTSPDNLVNFGLALVELGNASTSDAAASEVQSGIGSVLVSTYRISCSTTQANKDLCANLKSAIDTAGGESNTRAVAVAYITDLLN